MSKVALGLGAGTWAPGIPGNSLSGLGAGHQPRGPRSLSRLAEDSGAAPALLMPRRPHPHLRGLPRTHGEDSGAAPALLTPQPPHQTFRASLRPGAQVVDRNTHGYSLHFSVLSGRHSKHISRTKASSFLRHKESICPPPARSCHP